MANARAGIAGRRSRVVFTGIPYGSYALSVLHDEKLDGRMESGLFGMPLEGHEASSDARRGVQGRPVRLRRQRAAGAGQGGVLAEEGSRGVKRLSAPGRSGDRSASRRRGRRRSGSGRPRAAPGGAP